MGPFICAHLKVLLSVYTSMSLLVYAPLPLVGEGWSVIWTLGILVIIAGFGVVFLVITIINQLQKAHILLP